MKMFFTVFCRSMQVLTVALLGGAGCQQEARAQAPEATLAASAVPVPSVGITPPTLKPELTTEIVTPVIKKSKTGAGVRINTAVTLTNQGGASAKNVTVAAYLSDDGILSSDDTNLASLKLADYKNKGNLKPGKAFTVPLPYRIPSAFVDAVQGKYLIFVATADNFAATGTAGQAVYGPIVLP